MSRGVTKIKVLDGLRGYAALMIVLAHIPQISDTSIGYLFKQAILASKMGYLGVDIFFVLSGFLITRILIMEKKENIFSLKIFYIKRALRIFPIYYLAIIVCGFLFSWEGLGYVSVYLSNYYFSFTSDPNPLRHTWSLAVEEHYYLLWPIMLYSFRLERVRKIIQFVVPILVVASLVITYVIFDNTIADNLVYRGTQFRMLSLSIGSVFAFYEPQIRGLSKSLKIKLCIGFVFIYILSILVHKTIIIDAFPKAAILLVLFSICSSLFFMLILLQEGRKNLINYLFTNKVVGFVGRISYGVYLYHYIVFYFFGITDLQLNDTSIPVSGIVLPVFFVFLISTSSYYIFERPLLRYKSKLMRYRTDQASIS
ncbi:acyltransferase [Aquimarina gracilis]|uniref:Acyltransferase n=1 Tax=Aquimarina gracilis TaxID=874422 RepID=A0ABU6A0E7_9FLAO|nr:acyltransferase [Aquimarina gracilis]MEB3347629.1 acyltransferase [Aquimarina gracilis]